MTIPVSTVTVTPLGGVAADVSCDVADVSIIHGRGDPGQQPDASTANITMPIGLASGVEIGAAVQVLSGTSVRFVGTVTDMSTGWEIRRDPVVGDMVPLPVAQIIAVGPLAATGRRYIGDEPWPEELDGARVARVLTAAVPAPNVGTVDPGTVNILPRDVDRQPALSLMQDVANDAVGVLWQTRDGKVSYADAAHRHGEPIAVTLDACDVIMSPRWSRTLSGLINDVAVIYGPTPTEGERPAVTASAPESIAAYGRIAYSVTTELAAIEDANDLAQLLMVRNAQPAWLLDGVDVDLAILDAATTADVLALDVHSLLAITGFPAGGPTSSAALWVEGFAEAIAYGEHTLSLYVSSYCRTVPPPTWDEVPPEWTWDTVGGVTVTDNLVTNPSAETAAAAVVVRTNLAINPVVAADVTQWGSAPGPGGVTGPAVRQTGQTGWALGVTTSARVTWTTGTSAVDGGINVQLGNATVVPGRTYGVLLQARSSKAQRLGCFISWRDDAGTTLSNVAGDVLVVTANGVTTFHVTAKVAPAGAGKLYVLLYAQPGASGTAWAPGDWLEATIVHVEETDVGLVAPGGSALTGPVVGSLAAGIYGPDYTYAWAGAANASASQQRAPGVAGASVAGPAVVSRSSEQALFRALSERIVFGTGAAVSMGDGVLPGAPLTIGRVYTWSRYVYVPAGGVDVRLSIDNIGGSAPATARDQWVRLTKTFTATATTHALRVLNDKAAVRGNDVCYVDGSQLEVGPEATAYFDGATPDTAAVVYDWLGAADASASRRITPKPPTWDSATCFGPLPTSGRWADVPASMRWDAVATSVTWDTWKG